VFLIVATALVATPLGASRYLTARNAHLATRGAVTAAGLAMAVCCIVARLRATQAIRRGWLLLGLTGAGWAAANLIAGYSEVVDGRVLPVPSPADIPSAVAVVLAIMAILSFLEASLSASARMRTLLDGLLIASTLLFVGWATVLADVYAAGADVPERGLALGYPLSDLALVAVLLLSLTRVRFTRPWMLLVAGVALHSIGHAAFAYLEVAQAYAPGFESVSWVGGSLLIALAALTAGDRFAPRQAAPRAGNKADILVPCIPLALCVVIAAEKLSSGPLSTFLLVNAGVIVVLLVARQLLAQLEYLDLHRELEASVMHTADVMTVVDPDLMIRYQSGAAERVLGYHLGEVVGTPIVELLPPNAREQLLAILRDAPAPPDPPASMEVMLRRSDDEWVLTETTVTNLMGHPDVRGYLLTSRDLGTRRALDEHLRDEALTDAVTGLPNRLLFMDRVRHAVARSARHPEMIGLLLIDLDGFKQVNDTLGYTAGDQLLFEVARRLGETIRKGDTLARLGGDEFGVLLERADEESPTSVAQRVQYRLRAPVTLGGRAFVVTGSVGVVAGSTAALTAEDLLRNADLALTQAKTGGRGGLSIFTPDMRTAARRRVEVESDLRRALDDGDLVLHYQPVVELATGRISGAEALVRWTHAERGLIAPNEFVGIAEESDLALALGRWVLKEACRHAHQLEGVAEPPFAIGVNLSARQLDSEWLVSEVRTALEAASLHPRALMLEIPESVLGSDAPVTRASLEALREIGVGIAIDDFGTGWSSLSRLRGFPIDKLKIDRPFVAEIHAADDEAPMVAAIVAMADSLNVSTVAEGVETADQLSCLYRHGCREAQGYGVYRPLPVDELARLLTDHAQVVKMIAATPLSADAQSYAGAVTGAASATAPIGEVVQPLLNQLLRVTGADAAFVAELDMRQRVEWVRYTANTGRLQINDSMVLSIDASPSGQAMRDGSAYVADLRRRYAEHRLCELGGVRCHLAVPIVTPEGAIFGTLSISSARPLGIERESEVLVDLFARLIGDHSEVRRRAAAQEIPESQPV